MPRCQATLTGEKRQQNKQTDLKLNKHGDNINNQAPYELPVVRGKGGE